MRRFILTVVALVAAALMITPATIASASPKAHAAAFVLNGKSSQNLGVRLTLSSSLKRARLQFGYDVTCASGATYSNDEDLVGRTQFVAKRGHHISRVKFGGTVQDSGTINTPSGPIQATLETTVTGNVRLDTGNAKGRIEVTLQLANGDKCTTGIAPITYSVSIRR